MKDKLFETWALGFFLIIIYGFLEINCLHFEIRWWVAATWLVIGIVGGIISIWTE
jgi:hypothetical protein